MVEQNTNSIFTGEAWECKGEWDELCKEKYDGAMPFMSNPDFQLKNTPESIGMWRGILESIVPNEEPYTTWGN
jgi:hypothetical protein